MCISFFKIYSFIGKMDLNFGNDSYGLQTVVISVQYEQKFFVYDISKSMFKCTIVGFKGSRVPLKKFDKII